MKEEWYLVSNSFTCIGPYAILIMLGIKRVENRSVMPVPGKGRCAVSCSKSFNAAEYGNFVQWASTHLPPEDFERIPAWSDVKDWPGKIIGCCDYAARAGREPYRGQPRENWDEGYPYWWDLSEVVCFDRPIPCRGNVGMWQMPNALAVETSAADVLARLEGTKVASVADAARIFRVAVPIAMGNEGLFVLPLDAERRVIAAPVLVSLGEPTTAVVHPAEVFAVAFKHEAKAVILAHNHPSGDPSPSEEDVAATSRLIAAAEIVDVRILDHIVLGATDSGGGGGYASIAAKIRKTDHA